MGEEAASELFKKMFRERGIESNKVKMQPPDSLVKDFRAKTNPPIRKITAYYRYKQG
ncbi:MAG TPA: hypothetical protein GXX19_01070 [Syntrophomonadaceae bacterium]|nr:hypothetical protein [Syntrophomonadaceae bacterium]